jgi:hypothetical protein
MAALRVIQWTTGKVGKHSLRAIISDPRLKPVCAAMPGLLTPRDAGLSYSPVGPWT